MKVKNLKKRVSQKKKSEKKRFRKKIKFIRPSGNKKKFLHSEIKTNLTSSLNSSNLHSDSVSKNFETDSCLTLSLLNWSKIFLQESPFPFEKNGRFSQNFFNVLKKLCLKENEFVEWILYIEYYISKKNIIDMETLFAIGLFVKKPLDLISNVNYGQEIKKEKMDEIKDILEGKKINFIEFNKKYNYFQYYTRQEQNYYYNINSMIDFIYSNNTHVTKNPKEDNKIKKIEKAEEKQEQKKIELDANYDNNQVEINEIEDKHNILLASNRLEFEPMPVENNDLSQENGMNELNYWQEQDIHGHDKERLPAGGDPLKLDSSNENLENSLKCLFDSSYFLQN